MELSPFGGGRCRARVTFIVRADPQHGPTAQGGLHAEGRGRVTMRRNSLLLPVATVQPMHLRPVMFEAEREGGDALQQAPRRPQQKRAKMAHVSVEAGFLFGSCLGRRASPGGRAAKRRRRAVWRGCGELGGDTRSSQAKRRRRRSHGGRRRVRRWQKKAKKATQHNRAVLVGVGVECGSAAGATGRTKEAHLPKCVAAGDFWRAGTSSLHRVRVPVFAAPGDEERVRRRRARRKRRRRWSKF